MNSEKAFIKLMKNNLTEDEFDFWFENRKRLGEHIDKLYPHIIKKIINGVNVIG